MNKIEKETISLTDNRYVIYENREIYSPKDVAELLHISVSSVYSLARNELDPLPLRRFTNVKRGSFVLRDEFLQWIYRNSCLLTEIENNNFEEKPWKNI